LENERSTKKLLERILDNTKVDVDEGVKNNALRYLEMRHIFIHRAGVADEEFIRDYGSVIDLDAKGRLPRTFVVASAAIAAASLLCASIDGGLIQNKLVQAGNPNQRVADSEDERTGEVI